MVSMALSFFSVLFLSLKDGDRLGFVTVERKLVVMCERVQQSWARTGEQEDRSTVRLHLLMRRPWEGASNT